MLGPQPLGDDRDGGGAIADPARVAGGDGAALDERRPEPGEAFSRDGTWAVVGGLSGQHNDLVVEDPGTLRFEGAGVAAGGVGVLPGAGDA